MNLFRDHIFSLPSLVEELAPAFELQAARALDEPTSRNLERLFITGCGDSHFAAATSKLAFEQIAGVPVEAQTAMQFSRYSVGSLAPSTSALVLGVSVSGGVSRTVEALVRANARGLRTMAITSSRATPIGAVAQGVLPTTVPDLPNAQGVVVPGARSFYASLLMLVLMALRLAEVRGAAGVPAGRSAISALPELMRAVTAQADAWALNAARATLDAREFVFCGSGPNHAIAQFCAAKFLEATGDSALGQDVEEWAHLQYFAKDKSVPTLMIVWSGGADASRAEEVTTAMNAIGRRVLQFDFTSALTAHSATIGEWLAPFLTALPGMLMAAHRAELLGEPYFRGFGGGRSVEGGGGISRIRSSAIVV